ncbi:MAG: hypothetical protein DCF30_03770 [Hyphomicrobiales bacterium]|nr:MAG: hypothetical protein DCF30_03770 [Hyphomicrobiales bacterium]
MPHLVEELRTEAEAAMTVMRETALAARQIHARAELMRHMLTTARKVKDKPKADAVEIVVREWMDAWNLDRQDWPQLTQEMQAFTAAFHDYANVQNDAHDQNLRRCCYALDTALAREGTSISEQMAYRSQCAHGWWALVKPEPVDLLEKKPRTSIPQLGPGQPFWEVGCADFCI